MEELFFAGLIGNVQIDSVIPYILRMEADEYRVSLLNVSFYFKKFSFAFNSISK